MQGRKQSPVCIGMRSRYCFCLWLIILPLLVVNFVVLRWITHEGKVFIANIQLPQFSDQTNPGVMNFNLNRFR